MKYIYVDNFRGFSDTLIPLMDVNFLVGENSSGKTSFLTMLRMLSSTILKAMSGRGLYMSEADDADTEADIYVGDFAELVSAHSEDKGFFRLGYVDDRRKSPKKKIGIGFLITFREENGIPVISQITTMNRDREVHLEFIADGTYRCKSSDVKTPNTAEEMLTLLDRWKDYHKSPANEEWQVFKLPDEMPRTGIPIFILLAMAANDFKQDEQMAFQMPPMPPELIWIAPIRTAPRRTYDEPFRSYSSEGSHTPYVIRRMLKSKDGAKKFHQFMEEVGRESGLFEKIEIHVYGDKASDRSPFEVDAYLDDKALNVRWMGYGVSQSLPIFVELLDRKKGRWFGIQQPEVHLHPRAQACLGDVFFQMAYLDSKKFIVETHSDYTIDRFRMNYRGKRSAKERAKMPRSQIMFFERRDGRNTITPLAIDDNGELPSDQPESYRNFFIKEQMRLLEI